MQTNQSSEIPAGWKGGFATTNPDFAYPTPNLSSLEMLDNMANIPLLERQQPIKWPEFSWLTILGDDESRCFQMFAPYISRLGYTDEGRVYSIICPQQGIVSPSYGCLNVEVTVTGQRGWADENNPAFSVAADMTVEGKIWFSPSATASPLVKKLWDRFKDSEIPFPSDKANAIKVSTHRRNDPKQPIFPLLAGETTLFESPSFAKHNTPTETEPAAWAVGHIEVEIGTIKRTGNFIADVFNETIMKAFNLNSGNMLAKGNLLTWNVWFTKPELVNQQEWRTHAERWRDSIQADHGSPEGEGTTAVYFDGTPFKPLKSTLEKDQFVERGIEEAPADTVFDMEQEMLQNFLTTHFDN